MSRYLSVFVKSIRDQKWQIVGYGLALAVMAALIIAIWPSYRDTVATIELPEALQAFIGGDLNYSTAPGFVSAEFFSWIPILLIVYAVVQGTSAVAGEESSGTIDLLISQPVSRSQMMLQKTVAVIAGSALIVAIGFLGFAVTIPPIEIELSVADTAVACVNLLPITLLFYALSLWLGSVAPSRTYAAGVAVAVATAAYFINAIASLVDSVSGIKYASPFYYYGNGLPLVHGLDWPHVALLLGLSALFVALAVHSFERRDVIVGGVSGVGPLGLLRRIAGLRGDQPSAS